MNNQPQRMIPPPHVCFSGTLSCSGCNPCERCLEYVQRFVLPVAMMYGGLNQNPQQANAVFQGFIVGWQQFHVRLSQDRQLQQELKVTDLSQVYRQEGLPQQQTQPQIPQPFIANCQNCGQYGPLNPSNGLCISGCAVQQPVMQNSQYPVQQPQQQYPVGMQPFPNVPNMPVGYGQPGQPIIQAPIHEKPNASEGKQEVSNQRESEDKRRVQNMTTPKEEPIQADEIVSSAAPVQNANGPGVVLGSVMGPGFVPKLERKE